jgi:hypothetical protein
MKDAAFFITIGLIVVPTAVWEAFTGRYLVGRFGVMGWLASAAFMLMQVCSLSLLLRASFTNPGVLAKNSNRLPLDERREREVSIRSGRAFVKVPSAKAQKGLWSNKVSN